MTETLVDTQQFPFSKRGVDEICWERDGKGLRGYLWDVKQRSREVFGNENEG